MNDRPTIVVLGFHQTFEKNAKTGNADKPVDWVTYAPIHAVQSTQIVDRVDMMRPPEFIANDDEGKKMDFMRFRWAMIERAYDAWKDGIEIPEEGTSLAAWPALNAAQVNAFRNVGLRTVEAVATMPDTLIAKVALPSVREIKRQAAIYIEAKATSGTASRLSDLEASNAALQEQLAAAMELLEQHTKSKKAA